MLDVAEEVGDFLGRHVSRRKVTAGQELACVRQLLGERGPLRRERALEAALRGTQTVCGLVRRAFAEGSISTRTALRRAAADSSVSSSSRRRRSSGVMTSSMASERLTKGIARSEVRKISVFVAPDSTGHPKKSA